MPKIFDIPMNESSGSSVTDLMGNFNGTATSGNARRFNGTTARVDFTNPIIPMGGKTIKFKFRKSAPHATSSQIIMSNAGWESNLYGTTIYVAPSSFGNAGSIVFQVVVGVSVIAIIHTIPVCDGKWHEIEFHWDGTISTNKIRAFVDGILVRSSTATALETNTPSKNLRISGYYNGVDLFEGDLDDIQIINGIGQVVAHWRMNETSGNLVDSSGNNYTGTNYNTIVLTNDSMPVIRYENNNYFRWFNGRGDIVTFANPIIPIGNKKIRFKIRIPNKTRTVNEHFFGTIVGGSWEHGIVGIILTNGNLVISGYRGVSGQVNYRVESPLSIADGLWHEVLFHWSGKLDNPPKLYIDNFEIPVTVAENVFQLETNAYSNNLTIGALSTSVTSGFFEGGIKDFQVGTNDLPILSNIKLNQTNIWHSETGNINLTASVTDIEGDRIRYKIDVNNVEAVPFSILQNTPININIPISSSIFNINGNNLLRLVVEDETSEQTIFEYTIKVEDRDTFTFNRVFDFNEYTKSGDVNIVYNQGAKVSGVGTGEVLLQIPTDGKASIQNVVVTGDNDTEQPVQITESMQLVEDLGEGKVYTQTIDLANYKKLNIINVNVN